MGLFLYDTFTNTDSTALTSHTPEKGGSYSIHPSGSASPVITSNRARSTNAVTWVYNNATPPTADYVAQVYMRQFTDEIANAGIQARLSTSADTYYIARYSQDANEVQLRKVIVGTGTSLGTSSLSLANGDELLLTLACRDDVKQVWANGVLVITSTDNEITSKGVVGIRYTAVVDGSTQGLHFDYIRATSYSGLPFSKPLRPAIFSPGIAR